MGCLFTTSTSDRKSIKWEFNQSVMLKAEGFFDDYKKEVNGKSFDVIGFILAINVLF